MNSFFEAFDLFEVVSRSFFNNLRQRKVFGTRQVRRFRTTRALSLH